jgi:sulfur-carrier protein adenylyltransferase/sulfurtransferase
MKWKEFFKPVGNIDSKELRAYTATHQEGTYTLLDVRQMREYEESRIPGSTLIPLPQLSNRLGELDPEKPVLVYCAIGGRSRAAAQLLAGEGFREVYNLQGGIKAWNGLTAEGPVDFGSEISSVKEMFPIEVVDFAMGMEKGLAAFYVLAARKCRDKAVADLLNKLAGFEEKHQQKLLELYQTLKGAGGNQQSFEGKSPSVMEGGFDITDFMEKNRSLMETTADVLSLAMMLESQSLDLYVRLAGHVDDEESRAVLHGIADDENAHLSALGEMIEALIPPV